MKTKNKKNYKYSNKHNENKRKENYLFKGFLIYCNKFQEKAAVRECYSFLHDTIEMIYPNEITHFNNEIKDFQDIGIKRSNIFIKINNDSSQICPLRIVLNLMEQIHNQKKIIAKQCHRIIPILFAFRQNKEKIKQKLLEMIDEYFPSQRKTSVFFILDFKYNYQWKLEIKKKFITKTEFDKNELISLCHQIINQESKVDYKCPEYTIYFLQMQATYYILIQLIQKKQNITMLSILKDYYKYKKYSLHQVSEQLLQQNNTQFDKYKIPNQYQESTQDNENNFEEDISIF